MLMHHTPACFAYPVAGTGSPIGNSTAHSQSGRTTVSGTAGGVDSPVAGKKNTRAIWSGLKNSGLVFAGGGRLGGSGGLGRGGGSPGFPSRPSGVGVEGVRVAVG